MPRDVLGGADTGAGDAMPGEPPFFVVSCSVFVLGLFVLRALH